MCKDETQYPSHQEKQPHIAHRLHDFRRDQSSLRFRQRFVRPATGADDEVGNISCTRCRHCLGHFLQGKVLID